MKKGVKILLILTMVMLPALMLVGCNRKKPSNNNNPSVTPTPPEDSKITVVVSFRDKTVTYQEGKNQTIEVEEQLPSGVTVSYYLGDALFYGATNAGTYNITARFTVTSAYNPIEDKHATLTINKKALNVTPFPYTGELKEGDFLPVIRCDQDAYGSISLDQGQILVAGTHDYNWTFTPNDINNYAVVKGKISLTVTRVIINPDNPLAKVELPDQTFTYDGTAKSLQLINVPEGANVYYSDNNSLTDVGFADVAARVEYNSDAIWCSGRLEIVKNTLTITAENKSQVYGEQAKELTYQLDKAEIARLDSTLNISIEREAGETVNSYNITINASSNNFNIITVPAVYEITKRDVTITIDDLTATYGDEIGAYSYQVTDGSIVNDDDLQVVYTRQEGINVGDYDINATASNPNYNVTVNKGTIHITPRTLRLQINPSTSTYGDEIEFNCEDLDGLVYEDSAQSIGLTLSIQELDVGSHKISAAISSNNYTLEYNQDAQHIITERHITIQIHNYQSTYGDPIETNFEYDVTNGSIVNNDDLHIRLFKAEGDIVGTYEITYTYDNANYFIDPDSIMGIYTIIKKVINTDNLFDQTEFIYEYDGLTHFIVLDNIPDVTLDSSDNSGFVDRGSYPVHFTINPQDSYNCDVSNHSVVFTLTINPRQIDTSNYIFGPFTWEYTGSSPVLYLNGDNVYLLNLSFSGDINQVEVGDYNVHCHAEPISTNYVITKSDFDSQLHIIPAPNNNIPDVVIRYEDGEVIVDSMNTNLEYQFNDSEWQDSNRFSIKAEGDQILNIYIQIRFKATHNYQASTPRMEYIQIDKNGIFYKQPNPNVPTDDQVKYRYENGKIIIDPIDGCEYAIEIVDQNSYYSWSDNTEFEIEFYTIDPDNPEEHIPTEDPLTIEIYVRYKATDRQFASEAYFVTIMLSKDGSIRVVPNTEG